LNRQLPPGRFAPVVVAVGLVAASCGALDDSAPLVDRPKACKTLDEYLEPLNAQVAAGKMNNLGRIIREELDRASLRAIVKLALDTIKSLPPGTFETLAVALDKQGAGDRFIPLILAFIESLPGDPKATPPKPARLKELQVFSRVANHCLSPQLFGMATGVLRDKRLEPAMKTLFANASGLGPTLEKALANAGVEGRKAIVALIRNVAVSIAAPNFEPKPLVDMIAAIAGDDPTLGAVRDLLVMLVLKSDGTTNYERVAALSGFVGCFIDLDESFDLPGYWYDIVAGGAITLAFGATPTSAQELDDSVAATMQVLAVMSYLTDALASDEAARDALGQAGGLVLRPDLAVEAIPEVVELLRSDALDGLPGLLSDIATRPCLAQAPL